MISCLWTIFQMLENSLVTSVTRNTALWRPEAIHSRWLGLMFRCRCTANLRGIVKNVNLANGKGVCAHSIVNTLVRHKFRIIPNARRSMPPKANLGGIVKNVNLANGKGVCAQSIVNTLVRHTFRIIPNARRSHAPPRSILSGGPLEAELARARRRRSAPPPPAAPPRSTGARTLVVVPAPCLPESCESAEGGRTHPPPERLNAREREAAVRPCFA